MTSCFIFLNVSDASASQALSPDASDKTGTGGISAYHKDRPIKNTGIPYTKPRDDNAPSPPPSFKKKPANENPVKMIPTENTTNGNENPLNSNGTVSLKVTPSGRLPVGLFAEPPFRPHLISILQRDSLFLFEEVVLGPVLKLELMLNDDDSFKSFKRKNKARH